VEALLEEAEGLELLLGDRGRSDLLRAGLWEAAAATLDRGQGFKAGQEED